VARRRLVGLLGPAILLAAALAPGARPVAALGLALGWLALRASRSADAVAWAAALPLGLALAGPSILGTDVPLGEVGCADPFSPIAVRRLVLAVAALGVVGVVGVAHDSPLRELGLRRPTRREASLAAAGCLILAVGGLIVGPAIARPFFGPLSFPIPPDATLPAVVFGLANGLLEEVLYRGALQAWLARVVPIGAAILVQGLVFGIVHAGPDVLALLPLHVALLGAVGVAGGLVRWRTGSLWIPVGVHVGADIALYFGLACRPAAG
jgi:membrane protease YdiL (CAAX protease family)